MPSAAPALIRACETLKTSVSVPSTPSLSVNVYVLPRTNDPTTFPLRSRKSKVGTKDDRKSCPSRIVSVTTRSP